MISFLNMANLFDFDGGRYSYLDSCLYYKLIHEPSAQVR